jgi:hypothetical protein
MITVGNTNLTNTFDYWRNRTNEMANYFTTCVITTDANGSSVTTTGNAYITGNFTVAGKFISGNTTVNTVANSSSLTISNTILSTTIGLANTYQWGNNFHLASNGAWTYVSVSNSSVSHTGNNLVGIDAIAMSAYNGAEYLLSVKDNNANNYYTSKVLLTHDTTTAYVTEYASFLTNTAIGVFTGGSNTTHAILYFTGTQPNASANYTVKFVRTIV